MVTKILPCPKCNSTFRLDEDAIGDTGRTVRCASCKHEWLANRLDLRPDPDAPQDPKTEEKIDIPVAPPQETPAAQSDEDAQDAFSALMGDAPITVDAQSHAVADDAWKEEPEAEATPTDTDTDETVTDADDAQDTLSQDPEDVADTSVDDDEDAPDDSVDDIPDFATLFPEIGAQQAKQTSQKSYKGLGAILHVAQAACVLLIIITAFIAFRAPILQQAPMLKPLYAMAGYYPTNSMMLADIVFSKNIIKGDTHYNIKGNIVNNADESAPTPAIRARLHNKEGDVVAEWNLHKQDTLKPLQHKAFNARKLSSPAKDVAILSLEIGSKVELMVRD